MDLLNSYQCICDAGHAGTNCDIGDMIVSVTVEDDTVRIWEYDLKVYLFRCNLP